TYTIIPTAAGTTLGNYTVMANDGTLTVAKATMTISADNASREYGDANPSFVTHFTGAKNSETFTVTASTTATAASAVGTYAIVPAAAGATLANYTVVDTDGTLAVAKATLTISADNASREYGDANPSFVTHFTGAKNSETFTVTASTTATAASAVGTYAIVP